MAANKVKAKKNRNKQQNSKMGKTDNMENNGI